MDLWTEFEGITIDSDLALTRLLASQGRSAFFSTRNANGEAVLIRIIECHFDEDEILARWRGVQALGHPNFLSIDRFGQFLIEEDDITAVYAVFERVDENLGEVLERGRLGSDEAREIGLSVASALEELHASGFVHEHVETRNIYAVGNKVKLRSDCIREIPEGDRGREARRRDVRELGAVLEEVLLGARLEMADAGERLLPAPFDGVVRNAMNGSWGLAEMKAALGGRKPPEAPPPLGAEASPPPGPAPALEAWPATEADSEVSDSTAKPFWFDRSAEPGVSTGRLAANGARQSARLGPKPWPMEVPVILGIPEREFRRAMLAAGGFVLLVLMGWFVLDRAFRASAGAVAQRVSGQPAPNAPRAGAAPAGGVPDAIPAKPPAGSPAKVEWRVVAYTFDRQEQAQKKAARLDQRHPEWRPAVFSPSGRAPWLVTVGGAMQRDAAYALAHRARRLGLPPDTYAKNYTVR